ncbi:hypothetical protein HGQ62_01540 [Stenotrophomonas maltophilia]|nr:hypothetical protein [Stenotrophomonas maltophilia]NMT71823.1 hypothetical protein [Stenotrophomonas maltophilia]
MDNYGLFLKEVFGSPAEVASVSTTLNLLLKDAKEKPVWIGDFDGAEGVLYTPANAAMGLGSLPVYIVRQSQTSVTLVGHAPQKREFASPLYTITSEQPLALGNELEFAGATVGSASLKLRFVVQTFQLDKK